MRRRIHPVISALLMSLGLAACSPSPTPDPTAPGNTGTPPPTDTAPVPTATEAPTGATPPSTGATPPPAGSTTLVVSKDACKTDEDCAPSTCCLATACGAAAKAPDCSAVRCRRDCSTPTVECGGGCLCQNGFCAAKLGTTAE